MGQAKQRGTRDERMAQSQAVAVMRRDQAAAVASTTAIADTQHAAQQRIKQIDREDRAEQLRSDPRTATTPANLKKLMLAAATIAAICFSPKAIADKGRARDFANFDK